MRKVRSLLVATGIGLMVGLIGCGQKEITQKTTDTQQIVDYNKQQNEETTEEIKNSENTDESLDDIEKRLEYLEESAVENKESSEEVSETDLYTENDIEKSDEAKETGVTEATESLEVQDGLMMPGESSWIDIGGMERQFENFKSTMPEGYRYMGFHESISSFSKNEDDKLITALVWYQDATANNTNTEDKIGLDLSSMGSAELTIVADSMGKALVNQIGVQVSDITTGVEKIDGTSYISVTFKNNAANGYFIFTLKDGILQGVMTVTDISKDRAESDALDILNKTEFNGEFCEQELNLQFTDNAITLIN